MDEYASLIHTKWDCKIYLVFIPKYRRKVLYKTLGHHLGEVFHGLARQRECKIEGGQLASNHVHILTSIPAKYAVSQFVGYIKGKSAIRMYASMKGAHEHRA
jgi:putative transposase